MQRLIFMEKTNATSFINKKIQSFHKKPNQVVGFFDRGDEVDEAKTHHEHHRLPDLEVGQLSASLLPMPEPPPAKANLLPPTSALEHKPTNKPLPLASTLLFVCSTLIDMFFKCGRVPPVWWKVKGSENSENPRRTTLFCGGNLKRERERDPNPNQSTLNERDKFGLS